MEENEEKEVDVVDVVSALCLSAGRIGRDWPKPKTKTRRKMKELKGGN